MIWYVTSARIFDTNFVGIYYVLLIVVKHSPVGFTDIVQASVLKSREAKECFSFIELRSIIITAVTLHVDQVRPCDTT